MTTKISAFDQGYEDAQTRLHEDSGEAGKWLDKSNYDRGEWSENLINAMGRRWVAQQCGYEDPEQCEQAIKAWLWDYEKGALKGVEDFFSSEGIE